MSIVQDDWPDTVFTVARAMAKHEGHDPDGSVVPSGRHYGPLLEVAGYRCAFGPTTQIWRLYAPLAQVAVDELTKKLKG